MNSVNLVLQDTMLYIYPSFTIYISAIIILLHRRSPTVCLLIYILFTTVHILPTPFPFRIVIDYASILRRELNAFTTEATSPKNHD